VKSFTDENDRRVKNVSITDSGMACCKTAATDISHMEETLLSGLSETEKVLFRDLLEKVFRSF
jgi:DNA-binding MarR family transcriptional regulator